MTSLREQLDSQGFAKTGDFGGQPKTRYYTPDGRTIMAPPDMHEFARRDAAGKVVEQGVRDANFDKGWLPMMPAVLQKYCGGCDKWHPTDAEVKVCIKKKSALVAKHTRTAQKELGDDRVAKLETDMGELKGMFAKIMEKLNG